MKSFIVFALCVAAASARFVIPDIVAAEAAEIKEILAAINHPSTDPATALALQQMLNEILGIHESPIDVSPVIIDEAPIAPSPVIVNDSEETIHVDPAVVDQSEPNPSSSPLVQIIINVKSSASDAGNAVVVENPQPSPVIIAENPEEIIEEPIISEIILPSPVIVEESPEVIVEEPIINAPVFPSPAIVLPETLN